MKIDLGPTPAQLRCGTKTHLGKTPRQDADGYLCRGRTGMKLTGKDSYRQYRGRCCATGLESASGTQAIDSCKAHTWSVRASSDWLTANLLRLM